MTVLRASDYVEHNELPCTVRILGIARLASIASIVKLVRYAASLRREKYRLVHCFFNDVSMLAPPLLRMFGIRVLVSRRDMGFWYNRLNLVVLRLAARFVSRYVANSKAVKQIVHDQEWVPSRKISVIYNGYLPRREVGCASSPATDLSRIPSAAAIVGIVANLRPIKRIDDLIHAFAVVRRRFPAAYLVVVGVDDRSVHGRSKREELEELASRLGIRDGVIFVGRVDDPAPYVRRFAVAVLCSESEGFSNAIIEYMQAGRPVVCTDTGGNPELVEDGRNGFLVPVGDIDALADRIGMLLSNPGLADRLGNASLETVRSTYSHTRMVMEHMCCYDQILSGRQFSPGLQSKSEAS